MDDEDEKALALLIRYCEEEATRLSSPTVVIHCLRIACDELVESAALLKPRIKECIH
jgi:hypothetical protein